MSEFLAPALISIAHHIEKSPKLNPTPIPVQRSPMLTAVKKSPYMAAENPALLEDDVFDLDMAASIQASAVVPPINVDGKAPASIDTPTAIDIMETMNLRTIVDKDVAQALVGDNFDAVSKQ